MRRSIPIFVMLLAQVINSMMPVCVIRCIGADGQQCVEIAGMDCTGCELPTEQDELPTADAAVESGCCQHHHEDAPAGDDPQALVSTVDCDCRHSMMDVEDQVLARSTIDDSIKLLNVAVLAPCLSEVGTDRAAVNGLRPCPSRLHRSPHLLMLATTVLRV